MERCQEVQVRISHFLIRFLHLYNIIAYRRNDFCRCTAPPQEQDTAEKHETKNIETEQSIVGKQAVGYDTLLYIGVS